MRLQLSESAGAADAEALHAAGAGRAAGLTKNTRGLPRQNDPAIVGVDQGHAAVHVDHPDGGAEAAVGFALVP